MTSLRILITGGAGFIGTHLAKQLLEDGHSVVILDNLLAQVHGDNPKPPLSDCEFICADARDRDAMAQAMNQVDVVHHLAAETGVGQSQYEIARYVSINTYGIAVVLEAAIAARVRQVVIASSRAVYGEGQYRCLQCDKTFTASGRSSANMDAGIWNICCPLCSRPCVHVPMSESLPCAPTSIYGITKLQQEELAHIVSRSHDLPVTILRLFNVFGPGQSLRNPYTGVLGTFFRRAVSGGLAEIYEDGQMLRDFVFVKDVVDVFRLCTGNAETFGRTLNVGTGEAVSLLQSARGIFRALAMEPSLTVSGRYRSGDIRHAVADVSELKATLGFRARTSFTQGLGEFVEWALEDESVASDLAAEQDLESRNLLRQGAQ
jgi:dTDP-L-rhamnose 4-epimerase